MKRTLFLFSLIFIVTVVLVGSIAWSKRAQIFSQILSSNLMVPVSIERVDFPGKGFVVLSGLRVSNTRGALLPDAFSARTITIQYDATSFYKEGMLIKELYLEGVALGLEIHTIKGDRNNWVRLFESFYTEVSEKKRTGYFAKQSWLNMLKIENVTVDQIRCEVVDKSLRKDHINLFKIPALELHDLSTLGFIDFATFLRLMVDPILFYMEKLASWPCLLDQIPDLPPRVVQAMYPQVEKQFFCYQSRFLHLQKKMQCVQVSLDEQRKVLQERFIKMKEAYDQFTSSLHDLSIEKKSANKT